MDPLNIPLPNQIPPAPRLDELPARVLHTATIETLIDYSEDLASRLKVHLRRGSQLEQQIIELDIQIADSERMRSALQAQIEILREKDRSVSEKHHASETRFQRISEDLNLVKLENSELQARLVDQKKRTDRMLAYQRRVRRWVQPGVVARERKIDDLNIKLLDQEAEILRLSSTCTNLRDELQHVKSESDRRLTAGERDRARLVDQYEKRVQAIEMENATLRSDLSRAHERVAVLDQTTSERARANNEKVFFERRTEELESQLKSETTRLKGAMNDLAQECATLRASVESARKKAEAAEYTRIQAEEARLKAETQLRSLREVWQENSIRLQTLESQNEALEQLNADLSKKLASQRENSRLQGADNALEKVGFLEDESVRQAKLKKLDILLSDLEMKAFGIQPPADRSPEP
jgi:chromosome segregation ATPase